MVYGLVLVVHVLVAFFLIGVILIQGGRGGLGEALGGAAAQSLFGGGANTVMTKITAVAGALFMVTCLSLAALSTQQGGSVIDRLPASVEELPATLPAPAVPPAQPEPAPSDAAPSNPASAPEPAAPATAP
jgi:preprotein translocase subunit SecG